MREGRRDCAAPPSETLALSIVPTDSLSELVRGVLHVLLDLAGSVFHAANRPLPGALGLVHPALTLHVPVAGGLSGRFLHLAFGLVPCALSPVLGSLTHRILLLQTVLTSIPKEDVMRTSAHPLQRHGQSNRAQSHPPWDVHDRRGERAADARDRVERGCKARIAWEPRRDRRILAGRDLPKEPGWSDRVLERR